MEKNKKPRVAFVVADDAHKWQVRYLENSLRKFHSEEELPLVVIGEKQIKKTKDPAIFYKATPYFAKDLLKEYELVIKLDADQIITDRLDYIFNSEYDIGTVYNWNRIDPQHYGEIGFGTIAPMEYYNCGFVAMRSEKLVKHWLKLCNSYHFDRMPFREQGFLNVICYYGEYNVRCFDNYDPVTGYAAFHGLISKGDWHKIELVEDQNKGLHLMLPKGADGFPERDRTIVCLHWAGADNERKLHYRTRFAQPVVGYLDYLTDSYKKDSELQAEEIKEKISKPEEAGTVNDPLMNIPTDRFIDPKAEQLLNDLGLKPTEEVIK